MRIFLRVNEEKKQRLIQLAEFSTNTIVKGNYYEGCNLIKYVYPEQTILAIM